MAASRRRKWWTAIACVAAALLVVAFFLPTLARPFIRAKLQAMLADQLDATLSLGTIDYLPPYGVRVRDARLVALDPGGKGFDLLTTRTIELKLARLPLLPGPLLIERLDVIGPSLHLIQTAAGTAGQNAARRDAPTTTATPRQRLSESFELRKVTVADAQLTFDDRTIAGAVPLVWRNLRLDMNTSPASAADYRFDVRAGDDASATLVANGALDIDRLRLRIDACDVTVKVDPAAVAASAVPGSIQEVLRADRVAGTLAVHVAGDLPLADPRESKLVATLELRDAAGRLPGAAEPLDALAASVTCWADPASLRVRVDRLVARRGDAAVEATLPSATIDVASGNVVVKDLTLRLTPGTDRRALPVELARALASTRVDGSLTAVVNGIGTLGDWRACKATCDVTPDAVRIATPLLPDALHDLAPFSLDVAGGVASLKNLRAAYGNDVFFLRAARVPLATLPEAIRVEQLAGCVTFDARRATYPRALEAQLVDAEPRGPFFFDGDATVDRASAPPAVNYRVRVTTERASLSPLRRRLPLFNVVSDLLVTPTLVTIDRFEADALAGRVALTGTVRPGPTTTSYAGAARLRRIDLNGLAALATAPGEPPLTIAGELDADVDFSGVGTDANAVAALRADGAVRVERGDLFHVPTLEAITNRMGMRSAATLGEASTTFALAGGLLRLTDAAIGSPAVGVRGNGTINVIDHRLDLQVIATPLNDWEKSLRGDGNGSVSNVAANVAGSVQHAMNKVTEDYLYRVHVGGTTAAPDVQVVTAPSLRDGSK